jgi:hypothetical protein
MLASASFIVAVAMGQLTVTPLPDMTCCYLSTATPLADGRVLIAGGVVAAFTMPGAGTLLFDPLTGAFAPGPPLLVARRDHSAARLANGDVLVVGGAFDTHAELYQQATGTWVDAGNVPGVVREDAQLLRLASGDAVYIGGRFNDGLAPGEPVMALFSPATKTWTTGMLSAGSDRACSLAFADGGVALFGGSGSTTLATAAWYTRDGNGTFNLAGSLQRARANLTCYLWPDGTVTLFGGDSGDGGYVAETEDVVLSTGQTALGSLMPQPADDFPFTQLPSGHLAAVSGTGPMATGLRIFDRDAGWSAFPLTGYDFSLGNAITLPTGRALLQGGASASVPVMVDERSDVLTPVGALPVPRRQFADVATSGGRVLVIGGEGNGGGPQDTVFQYDDNIRGWLDGGHLAVGRDDAAAAVLLSGQVFIAGGQLIAGTPLDSIELYDPASGLAVDAGHLLAARAGAVAVTLADGRVLVVGGTGADGGAAPTELFSPSTLTSQAVPVPALLHVGAAATRLRDGRVMIAGGTLETDLWSPDGGKSLAVLPVAPSMNPLLVQLPGGGPVLMAGGTSLTGTPVSSVLLFNLDAGTWTTLTDMPAATRAPGTALRSGELLLGLGGTGLLQTFDPLSQTWQSSDAGTVLGGTGARRLHSGAVVIYGGVAQTSSSATWRYREEGPIGLPTPATALLTRRAAPGDTVSFSGDSLLAPSRLGGAITENTAWDEVVFGLASLEGHDQRFIESHAQTGRTATAVIPTDALVGWYEVWPVVHGVKGPGQVLFIGVPTGAPCLEGAACVSGFCVAGFCGTADGGAAPMNDAGNPDAGPGDAGPSDGGTTDGGLPDGGLPDGGSLRTYVAGCGCGTGGGAPLLVLLILVVNAHRSRQRRVRGAAAAHR